MVDYAHPDTGAIKCVICGDMLDRMEHDCDYCEKCCYERLTTRR